MPELFDDEPGAPASQNGNNSNGANGNGANGKNTRAARPKQTRALEAQVAPATAAATQPAAPTLSDPFAEDDSGPTTAGPGQRAESSNEPSGGVPLMAAPTSQAATQAPPLPPRVVEEKAGQTEPDIFAGEGLTIERRYTKAGENVFDTIEWDRRTAAITGERGEVVFEQKDCEIPKPWSQLATNVVVSKYFRGKVGTPGRENSVRQLVSRVSDTIWKWGKQGGYFASDQDADAFHDELSYLLLHQHMAFNSPVWFNLGVPGEKPQVSACFINSVDDTMESILTLAKTEGMLFKWGSGTGTNLSVLRSSREGLKGGGTASGPVSFMRGFDAFAGAIKSGGKTRRAAKMVILDAAHPDVEEFIECKADAEKKAHALIEAGYSGAFNVAGGAYDSVFFQNANHSVRATDAFMQAVEQGGDFSTVNVLDDTPDKNYKARDLMHKIASAAWVCGDPGMQFDTTINRWHTCPNSDRINASNPCSEYMFLDDSACNLASLNLMRFRTPEREFDVEAFAHACRVTITAMEIMVGNAAYPTDKITVNSHDYRPLGLGYANLGALLMARGLPYDSDEGRAFAGAITAIMSGAAYHQSARMARRVGTFAGYEKNREPFLHVMQMHRDHVESIPAKELAPAAMIQAARQCWDDTLALGRDCGFRNSQISVLAPTGCLVGGSLVLTDRGLLRLNRLGDVNGAQWQDVAFNVLTDEGERPATKFYVNGVEATRRVVTRCGYAIQGTLKHQIKVMEAGTGRMVWKRFADVAPGDRVALSMGKLVGAARPVALPPLGEEYWTGDYTTRVPRTMTPELAELVGYFMGDGSLHSKGPRFCVANTDPDVGARIKTRVKNLFNLDAHLTDQQGYCEVAVHSVPLTLWWEACGFAKTAPGPDHAGKGYRPHVPDAVLATNDPAVYGAFLRGLYEADGTVTGGAPCWSTVHRPFSEEVKTLLLALGLPTSSKTDTTGWGNSSLYVLRLRNKSYAARFLEVVGFVGGRKTGLVQVGDGGEQTGRHDYVFMAPEVVPELVPDGHALANAVSLSQKRHGAGAITRRAAESLYAETGDVRLGHALGFFYDTVAANEDGGEQPTYDLSVPSNVTYIAQGFVSHNTIGFLMDCDTTGVEPDIAIVKYKSLVGGGVFKIVNRTVPEALERLGYSAGERKAILDYVDAEDTIEGAPGLASEHLPVFDCAFRAKNGTRTIHYMGHIRMMSAVQPFLSGAISKCVTGDTLIFSRERGVVPISSFYAGHKPDEFERCDLTLASIAGPERADLFYYGGVRPTVRLALGDGRTIEGTPNHRVKVANREGYGWKRLDEINENDFVAVKLGADVWAAEDAAIAFEAGKPYGCQKTIRVPERMSPELGRFLGYYIAEGNIARSNWTVRITNNNPDVLRICQETARALFGLEGRIETDARNGVTSWLAASKTLVELLDYLGCGGKSDTKQIPWSVLQSRRETVAAFIGGLWLDGYVRQDGMVAICLNSPALLRQLQIVLNNFGLRAQIIRKHSKAYDKYFSELGLHGLDARRFADLFVLDDAHKNERLRELGERAKKTDAVYSDVVPCFRDVVQAAILEARDTQAWRHVFDKRTRHLSWQTLRGVYERYRLAPLAEIVENNIHFVPVRAIESGLAEVFDFQVPSNHAFLGNAIVNHNTVNMPHDAEPDDIAEAYRQAWKMGVKALAIYRDGSKKTQPLSTSTTSEQGKEAAKAAEAVPVAVAAATPAPAEVRPFRRKLPDERQALTHKFSVGGHEGYLTVGLYPDGTPGEIFIVMSKEGSVVSGLMDSFATSISLALQYGVPLRTLVEKFMHTRFEPSGFTGNPDIPMAKSIMDYLFRYLALKFLKGDERANVGLLADQQDDYDNGEMDSMTAGTGRGVNGSGGSAQTPTAARPEPVSGETDREGARAQTSPPAIGVPTAAVSPAGQSGPAGSPETGRVNRAAAAERQVFVTQADAPPCPECGGITTRNGACYRCSNCGTSIGCS